MAATPYRCTVTIDGTKFNAVATNRSKLNQVQYI